MSRKAPFKGRPLQELLSFAEQCLTIDPPADDAIDAFKDLTVFLLDIDSDCNPMTEIGESPSVSTGLSPEAMVMKMDLLMERTLGFLSAGISDSFYAGLLEVFEDSVLKLYQPHYVQFITYFAASTSKSRADDFLSLLLNIVHDENSDPIARREGISFLGSFVCRAPFLGWTHSARTAKYLVSFMHSLEVAKSSSDRVLFILALQTVCYMICWECNRWKDAILSHEMDWVWRSKKGLVSILTKTKQQGLLRLVSLDILKMMQPLCGRISVQVSRFVAEAIDTYKQLLPPLWKPLGDSLLLKQSIFPFDPFHNLPRTCPLILPLLREWQEPGTAPDAPDRQEQFLPTSVSDEETNDEKHEENVAQMDEVWNYRPLQAAGLESSPFVVPTPHDELMCSPFLSGDLSRDLMHSMEPLDLGTAISNLVLNRIVSSSKFSPAP